MGRVSTVNHILWGNFARENKFFNSIYPRFSPKTGYRLYIYKIVGCYRTLLGRTFFYGRLIKRSQRLAEIYAVPNACFFAPRKDLENLARPKT